MNICVVSSYEGDVEEFMTMVAEFDEEMKSAVSDFTYSIEILDFTYEY